MTEVICWRALCVNRSSGNSPMTSRFCVFDFPPRMARGLNPPEGSNPPDGSAARRFPAWGWPSWTISIDTAIKPNTRNFLEKDATDSPLLATWNERKLSFVRSPFPRDQRKTVQVFPRGNIVRVVTDSPTKVSSAIRQGPVEPKHHVKRDDLLPPRHLGWDVDNRRKITRNSVVQTSISRIFHGEKEHRSS